MYQTPPTGWSTHAEPVDGGHFQSFPADQWQGGGVLRAVLNYKIKKNNLWRPWISSCTGPLLLSIFFYVYVWSRLHCAAENVNSNMLYLPEDLPAFSFRWVSQKGLWISWLEWDPLLGLQSSGTWMSIKWRSLDPQRWDTCVLCSAGCLFVPTKAGTFGFKSELSAESPVCKCWLRDVSIVTDVSSSAAMSPGGSPHSAGIR